MTNDYLELIVDVIGARGAHKAMAIADEYWIIEKATETLQCPTHRRLTQADTIRGPGHVPFLE
jgi:hypothetical protein